MFFSLIPESARLSDRNADLINFYRQVRDAPDCLIEQLEKLENSEDSYYAIRAARPTAKIERAARFLFLCSLSFNGIYRQNLKGEFNVPYGYRNEKKIFDANRIRTASANLQNIEILTEDFSVAVSTAEAGDLIYFDPPYTVAHNNNGFIKYNSKIFSLNDQMRLAKRARRLVENGCYVVISNANHETIARLYEGFDTRVIHRNSVIAASSLHRQPITECLYVGKPS